MLSLTSPPYTKLLYIPLSSSPFCITTLLFCSTLAQGKKDLTYKSMPRKLNPLFKVHMIWWMTTFICWNLSLLFTLNNALMTFLAFHVPLPSSLHTDCPNVTWRSLIEYSCRVLVQVAHMNTTSLYSIEPYAWDFFTRAVTYYLDESLQLITCGYRHIRILD